VVDGPFTETKELIAGFWIIEVSSKQEAIEWMKRCPNPMEGPSDIEIRQLFEMEDFGDALTPELRAQEEAAQCMKSATPAALAAASASTIAARRRARCRAATSR
jgi:hypothetical protein